MSKYLRVDARNSLADRVMKGSLSGKYKLDYLRHMPLKDVVDPGMTWGEFEDEMGVVAYIQGRSGNE